MTLPLRHPALLRIPHSFWLCFFLADVDANALKTCTQFELAGNIFSGYLRVTLRMTSVKLTRVVGFLVIFGDIGR